MKYVTTTKNGRTVYTDNNKLPCENKWYQVPEGWEPGLRVRIVNNEAVLLSDAEQAELETESELKEYRTLCKWNLIKAYESKLKEGVEYVSKNLTVKVDCKKEDQESFANEALRLQLSEYPTTNIKDYFNVEHEKVPKEDFLLLYTSVGEYGARMVNRLWYYKKKIKDAQNVTDLQSLVFDWNLNINIK